MSVRNTFTEYRMSENFGVKIFSGKFQIFSKNHLTDGRQVAPPNINEFYLNISLNRN